MRYLLILALFSSSCHKHSGCELRDFGYTIGKQNETHGLLLWVDSIEIPTNKFYSKEDCERVAMEKIRKLKEQDVTVVYRGVSPFRIEKNYYKLIHCECR